MPGAAIVVHSSSDSVDSAKLKVNICTIFAQTLPQCRLTHGPNVGGTALGKVRKADLVAALLDKLHM